MRTLTILGQLEDELYVMKVSAKDSDALGRPNGAIEDIHANTGSPGRRSRALHAPVPQVLHDNNGQSVARESRLRAFLTSSCDFISLRPRSARKRKASSHKAGMDLP